MKAKAFIPAVSLLCFWVLLGLGTSKFLQSENKGSELRGYISWEDLTVAKNVVRGSQEYLTPSKAGDASRVIVVDKKGRRDSVTIQGSVDMVPHNNSQRVKIYIPPGIYREKVIVPITKPYISFIGNQKYVGATVISWSDKASDRYANGTEVGTFRTATVRVDADFFCATAITFENTIVAVPGEEGQQAAALRITGDKAMFYRVSFVGSQDTLNDESGSHYFYKCHIEGTVDFIFGTGRSLYQNCDIRSTSKNFGSIAAHHRDHENDDTGFSFLNCNIGGTGKVVLGRAWGAYSRIIYSKCYIDDVITPAGWDDWKDTNRQSKVQFGEYNCRGKGAERRGRVPWSKSLTRDEVKPFLGIKFIYGDKWLRLNTNKINHTMVHSLSS